MRLNSLKVENFRNLESAELTPSPVLTVICGPNGQGKTNLLESIWLLTGARASGAPRMPSSSAAGRPLRCWRRRSRRGTGTRPCASP